MRLRRTASTLSAACIIVTAAVAVPTTNRRRLYSVCCRVNGGALWRLRPSRIDNRAPLGLVEHSAVNGERGKRERESGMSTEIVKSDRAMYGSWIVAEKSVELFLPPRTVTVG